MFTPPARGWDTYIDALEQIIRFIQNGRDYAARWDQLAARVQGVYEKPKES